MAVFEVWDRKLRAVSGSIEIHKSEVEKVVNVTQRVGSSIPPEHAIHSTIFLTDKSTVNVSVPAGEVQDRLNDDLATAPPPEESLFKDLL